MSKSLITNASTAMHEIKKSFIDKMNTGDSSRAISGDVRSRRKMPANS